MSFQIHSPEGDSLSINALDHEAAAFWGVEYHEKQYAHPNLSIHYNTDWFNSIGWAIHHPENYTSGWDNVKCTLWTIQAKELYKYLYAPLAMLEAIQKIHTFLKPYYELIDYWELKGYIPVQVKE